MSQHPFAPYAVRLCRWAALSAVLAGCSHVSFHPAPVVPTKIQLPYSAQVRLVDLGVYTVEAGGTMRSDPQLQNVVTQARMTPNLSQNQWEKALLDYLTARQTFQRVIMDGPADLGLALRIFIYIDPGVGFKFNHKYVAKVDALVTDAKTGKGVANYTGLGQAIGPVSRRSTEDDAEPINKSAQAALNDLFSKMENHMRVASL